MRCLNVSKSNQPLNPQINHLVTDMIEKIIDKNVSFIQRYIFCDDDDIEIYKYSLRIIYSYIIDVFALMFFASLTQKIMETLIMLSMFAVLQVNGGGFHAKTKLRCFAIMVIGWFVGLFGVYPLIAINPVISSIIIQILSTILIFRFTPVLNPKHPVNGSVYKKTKLAVRVFIIVINIMDFIFILMRINDLLNISNTVLLLYSVSLIVATIKKTV